MVTKKERREGREGEKEGGSKKKRGVKGEREREREERERKFKSDRI